jgi:hypothetical protein
MIVRSIRKRRPIMKISPGLFLVICSLLSFSWLEAQDQKPNFSGTWAIDREKSEFGPRGGERDRPPGGDDREQQGKRPPKEGVNEGEGGRRPTGGMFDSMVIEHKEPNLTIKRKMNFRGEERNQELKYTTNNKKNNNEGFFGTTTESKTHWEGDKLVTESTTETPRGVMETKEVRSLSADGNTMTVEMTTKGGPREGTRKIVFTKQPSN